MGFSPYGWRWLSAKYSIFSFGSIFFTSFTTDKPPMPESKKPIEEFFKINPSLYFEIY